MSIVLITGANRGLGLEFARQYAKDGWRVIATARVPEKATELHALGPAVVVHRLDVVELAAVTAFARALAGETVDVLIANAGISGPRGMRPEAIGTEECAAWETVFRVNAMAPLALAGAFVEAVTRSKERKMIAITSRLGSIAANNDGGLYGYRSSKAALNALWRSFAIDHPEIIATLLHPGWVRTDMGGTGAPLTPEESVAGMRRVIARLAKTDSGRFYDYQGESIPW
jgi:NAD(P)-dependent dehydrogenase (short-subunit alcohol dehydrogenase family)